MFHGDTFQPLEVNLALGEHSVQAVFPDAAGRHLYLGTYTQPSRVVRLAAPEMRRSASLTLPKGDDMIYCGARWGGAGVFGTSTLPGRLVKVDLETLAHLGTLEFNKCAPGPRRTRSAAALGAAACAAVRADGTKRESATAPRGGVPARSGGGARRIGGRGGGGRGGLSSNRRRRA